MHDPQGSALCESRVASHATPSGVRRGFTMLPMPPITSVQISEPLPTTFAPSRPSVILISPTINLLSDSRYLMLDDNYRVTAVGDLRELSLVRDSESFALAVISDTLGGTELVKATRLVRKQWPTARILVLGHAAIALEDSLYDDVLPHSSGEQKVCDILTRMSTQRTYGRLFIVTTPASVHESLERRHATSVEDSRGPDAPQRMTQTRTKQL
jgi:hypothetical protein